MKTKEYRIIALILTLFLLLGLYGCAGQSATALPQEDTEEKQERSEPEEQDEKDDSSDKSWQNFWDSILNKGSAAETSAEAPAEEASPDEEPAQAAEEIPAEKELDLADFEGFAGKTYDELAAMYTEVYDSSSSLANMGPVTYLGHPGMMQFFFNGNFMDCASWCADDSSEEVYEEVLAALRENGTDGEVYYPADGKVEQVVNVNGRDFTAGFEQKEEGEYVYVYTRYTPRPEQVAWTDAQVFSDGLAWIWYENAGTKASVIDMEGNILFTLKEPASYISRFHEGTAVYTVDGTETDVLIDAEGNEIYRTEGGEDQTVKRERIVGCANGAYLLVREESGISSAAVKAALMAPDGTMIRDYTDAFEEEIAYGGMGSSLADFLNRKGLNWRGDGWYECDGFMINFDRMQLCNMSIPRLIADFEDGDELVAMDHMNYIIRYDRNLDYISSTDVGGSLSEMKNGLFWWCWYNYDTKKNDAGYYNAKAERVIPVDAYPENKTYGSPFEDGLALLEIEGADGKNYLSMIDESGNLLFDPVVIKDYYPRIVGGYALIQNENEEFMLMDQTGETVHSVTADFPECDLAVSTQHGWSEYSAEEYDSSYSDGWLLLPYRHDGKFYKRLYPVTEAAKAGEAVFDLGTLYPGQYSREAAPETAAPEQEVRKEYVPVSDLIIEGKWKSIGSYGFGQAQPGSIVIFDGTHCNVFSPSDTYVFYEKGDHYVLETTSLLSTDTVSFTVRATDEDHIDLIQGEYVTELERME